LLASRRDRFRRLKELNAPQVIINNEKSMVSTAEIALRTKVGRLPDLPDVKGEEYDPIPEGQPGSSKKSPFVVAPEDWEENGIQFGAWCLCEKCGLPGRRTYAFDFFAEGPGNPLSCEVCRVLKLRKKDKK
jgi:hypothetical protein